MAQTRGTLPQLADNVDYRDVYVLIEQGLKELPPIWKKYYNVESSDRKTEITQSFVELGDVPEKGEGAAYATDILRPGNTKSVTHTEFGLGFEMTETAGEDDRFKVLRRNAKYLAYSARYVQERRAAVPLNNGFSTEFSADGVSAFNSAHVLAGGGTARNVLAVASDLSWNTLATAMIDVQTQTLTESGKFVMPIDSWTLVVPPAYEFTAARILNSTLLPGVADNDQNSLKARRTFTLVVNPHITDATSWYLFASDSSRHGLKSYTRIPITMVPAMIDARTGNVIFKVRFRQSWFFDAWQNAFATPGS